MNVQILVRQTSVPARFEQNIRTLCDEISTEYAGIRDIKVETEDASDRQNVAIERRCHLKVRGSHRLAIDFDRTDQDLSEAVDKAFRRLRQILARIRPRRGLGKETATTSPTKIMLLPGGIRHESDCHKYSVDWDC